MSGIGQGSTAFWKTTECALWFLIVAIITIKPFQIGALEDTPQCPGFPYLELSAHCVIRETELSRKSFGRIARSANRGIIKSGLRRISARAVKRPSRTGGCQERTGRETTTRLPSNQPLPDNLYPSQLDFTVCVERNRRGLFSLVRPNYAPIRKETRCTRV